MRRITRMKERQMEKKGYNDLFRSYFEWKIDPMYPFTHIINVEVDSILSLVGVYFLKLVLLLETRCNQLVNKTNKGKNLKANRLKQMATAIVHENGTR